MALVHFVTHPEVIIDPDVPVPEWPLSERGFARMRIAITRPWVSGVTRVWASRERKAKGGGQILATHLGLRLELDEALGENDRQATGYLARDEFEHVADEFFARPEESVRGWERAVDAQRRIVDAVMRIAALGDAPGDGDIAIVSHGGVGALLLCHLLGESIDRKRDQTGGGGGNRFVFERDGQRVIELWRPIEE